MKHSFKKTFWLITELMVSRNVPVVQEPHGLTELNKLWDFSNDNGKSCQRTLTMIGSEELPLEKLWSVLFGPETLNSLLVVILLWKLPLVDDHQIFWTLRLLILLNLVLTKTFTLSCDMKTGCRFHVPAWTVEQAFLLRLFRYIPTGWIFDLPEFIVSNATTSRCFSVLAMEGNSGH